jgi:hypothetical protein
MAIPVAIDLLVKISGLGGIANSIKNKIKEFQEKIKSIIVNFANKVKAKAVTLINKLRTAVGGARAQGAGNQQANGNNETPALPPEQQQKLDAGLASLNREYDTKIADGEVTADEAKNIAIKVKGAHPIFTKLEVVDKGSDWEFDYVVNPPGKVVKRKVTRPSNTNEDFIKYEKVAKGANLAESYHKANTGETNKNYRRRIRDGIVTKYQSLPDLNREILTNSTLIPAPLNKYRGQIFEDWVLKYVADVDKGENVNNKQYLVKPFFDKSQGISKDRIADGWFPADKKLMEVKAPRSARKPGTGEKKQMEDYAKIVDGKIPWIKVTDTDRTDVKFGKVRYLFSNEDTMKMWEAEMSRKYEKQVEFEIANGGGE